MEVETIIYVLRLFGGLILVGVLLKLIDKIPMDSYVRKIIHIAVGVGITFVLMKVASHFGIDVFNYKKIMKSLTS